jgi:hypothetical protein
MGCDPMRRNVRWVIDHRPATEAVSLSVAAV